MTASLLLYSNDSDAQDAELVKRQLVGIWISNDNSGDKYYFSSNGDCIHYLSSTKLFKYKYSITNDPKDCEPGMNKKVGDTTAYIQIFDIQENSNQCFVINGLSNNYFSIRGFGEGGGKVYIRQKRKRDGK